jgi:hypothetical protein
MMDDKAVVVDEKKMTCLEPHEQIVRFVGVAMVVVSNMFYVRAEIRINKAGKLDIWALDNVLFT